jgi:hypothetical protein
MKHPGTRRTAGIAAVVVAAILALALPASAKPLGGWQSVKAATARYHSIAQAMADGYTGVGEPCVASPDGAMGIHFINPELMADDAVDPLRPEILLYVPKANGDLALVGVEYWKADADGDLGTSDDRPSVLGQPLDGPMLGHTPTMPVHYDLHVWLWKSNPSGFFAPFNPTLSCQ